jgi:hypothetical protein
MDSPTRIGLGGGALFALAGLVTPIVGWWCSGPIMAVCALVAVWGFWPLIHEALYKLPQIGVPKSSRFQLLVISTTVAGAVFICFASWHWLDQATEMFEWNVGISLAMGRDSANKPTLRAMDFGGWNRAKVAVQIESAKAISGITGEVRELKIPVMESNHWINIPIAEATLVPPSGRVTLRLDFTENGSDGLSEDEASRRWARGYFEVRYSGKLANVPIDEANLARAFNDAKPKPPEPHVTRKQ